MRKERFDRMTAEEQAAWRVKRNEYLRNRYREASPERKAELRERQALSELRRRIKSPDQVKEQYYRSRRKNPESTRTKDRECRRRYRAKNPEKRRQERRRWWLRKYGLSAQAQTSLVEGINAALSPKMPLDMRGEIVSMMIEAVYDGRFSARDAPKHTQDIIREYFRQFSKFDTVSLDAVIGADGFTLGRAMGIH